MAFLLSLLPIVALIFLMAKKNGVPSYQALPLIAILSYLLKLVFFDFPPDLVHAAVLNGLLTAWTPVLIVFGAIFLFVIMELTGAMDTIRNWLNHLSSNPVAQLMLIGWVFPFIIEGASGFGTPAAIAAPILVGMGFPAVRVAAFVLVMNTVPVSFGAVGTPIWFGLGQLSLPPDMIQEISWKTGLIQLVCGLIIPSLGLLFVLNMEEIIQNFRFVLLASAAPVVPMAAISAFNPEFPSLVGGLVGFFIVLLAIKRNWGLKKAKGEDEVNNSSTSPRPSGKDLLSSLFPIWATILVLVITRIPVLGIQSLLRSTTPVFEVSLGSLGLLTVSESAVISIQGLYGVDASIGEWKHELLYVPSLLPFFLIGVLSLLVLGKPVSISVKALQDSWSRMTKPIIALSGALVLVKILMLSSFQRPSNTEIMGEYLGLHLGSIWRFAAVYLGGLGSFFSGSATVSNLTFGDIQLSISQDPNTGLEPTTILALQSVGAAMGNMVCIHNIVAVCSILGIMSQEGAIFKRNFVPFVIYGLIASITAIFL